MGSFLSDFRYGLRVLMRSPGFAAMAIVALAIGIGTTTAIFSVVDSILLRPLPLKDPEKMVILFEENIAAGQSQNLASTANFVDWKATSRSFETIAAVARKSFHVTGGREPEQIKAMLVTSEFFVLLRAHPLLGRLFAPEDYESPATRVYAWLRSGNERGGGPGVVILSHNFWRRHFGGDPSIIGRTILLDDLSTEVVGVMPPDFRFGELSRWGTVDCWIPQSYRENEHPRARGLFVTARLRESVSLEEGQTEMAAIARDLERKRPDSNTGWTVRVQALREVAVGDTRTQLLVLLAGVTFVLLIACANVAHLLLVRGEARKRETAVRTCLGASRATLIGQFFAESLILAIAGGAAGVLLAIWGVDLLKALSPPDLPRLEEIRIDLRVLGFTAVIALTSAMICGLVPALRCSRTDLTTGLKEGIQSSAGLRRRWINKIAVVAQIALALILLVGAGLLLRSFLNLRSLDLGFNPHNVLTFHPSLGGHRFERKTMFGVYEEILERIQTLPGVEAAAIGKVPLTPGGVSNEFTPEGGTEAVRCAANACSSDYFRVLEIAAAQGRMFTAQDREGSPPVAIVNRTAARLFWPGESPVGKRITVGTPGRGEWLTVVGLVEDVRIRGIEPPPPEIYLPMRQTTWMHSGTILVRTAGDPLDLVPAAKAAIWSYNKDIPIGLISTLEAQFSSLLNPWRFQFFLIGFFSIVAAILATVGVFGVMAYSAAMRRHEIGIRMAVGARVEDIVRLVLAEGSLLILAGEVLGIAGALVLSRFLSTLVYGIPVTDQATYALVAVVWAAVALLACYLPARKAASMDPLTSFRYE